MFLTRRNFLKLGFLASAFPFIFSKKTQRQIPVELHGANSTLAHRIRGGQFPLPLKTIETDVLIVGGGVSALAAAYRLQKSGIKKILLCEIESSVGGNSIGGINSRSAYPWGAHYVPILNKETTEVVELFKELGIIIKDQDGVFEYDDRYLCWDPEERLYINGRWQDGIVPNFGLTQIERAEIQRFHKYVEELRDQRGSDNKYLFEIPLKNSSIDLRYLDQISFFQWYQNQGYKTEPLRWYLDYCVRDDFGGTINEISAWAGLHYFCSRRGKSSNAKEGSVLTWPEGNYWLIKKIKSLLKIDIKQSTLCYKVDSKESCAYIYDDEKNESLKVNSKAILLATPNFVSKRLLSQQKTSSFKYNPWIVANFTLLKPPAGSGANFSWDNVIYQSKFLGYVNANHQDRKISSNEIVITYFFPCTGYTRNDLENLSLDEIKDEFVAELLKIHPELLDKIIKCDLWIWGHGMITPVPNFIWGGEREDQKKSTPPVFFAHTDLAGISIFEEGYTIGVETADEIINYLKNVD